MQQRSALHNLKTQQSNVSKNQAKPTVSAMNKQPKMIGPYQVGEVIGRGACGKVFKGLNFQNGQLVAIKQIKINNVKVEHKKSLQSEINLLKKLEHPNIVKYIDSIYTEHYLNIILEYVENGSLDSLIKKFGKFPETLVAIYVQQVLQGLDYLHTQVVIHRDIKGANILTTKDGIVKLADFGVATKLNDTEKSNSAFGTPYWMAPEVIEMSGQVTQACDIWSLGCTVIELLTGNPPYSNLQPVSAMVKIVQEGMPALPESITDELKDFLNKCFEKDPYRRIDAKGLLEHAWMKKYDKNLFQKIINNGNKLPEVVSNTIKLHINQVDKPYNSMYQKVNQSDYQIVRAQQHVNKKAEMVEPKKKIEDSKQVEQLQMKKPLKKEDEDEDGEIGDFGEEINDMNDVPIERPKCLSNINFNSNSSDVGDNTQSNQPPVSKLRKMQTSLQRETEQALANDTKLNHTYQYEQIQNTSNGEEFKEGYSFIGMKYHSKQRSIQNSKSGMIQPHQQIQEQPLQLAMNQTQSNLKQFQQVQLRQGQPQNTINTTTIQNQSLSLANQSQLQQFVNQQSASQRQNYKSQDKSAGPGSGDGAPQVKQSFSSTPQNRQLNQQQQIVGQQNNQEIKQIFDVQGNRKVYYLTKKNRQAISNHQEPVHSYGNSGSTNNPNDDSQLSMGLSTTQRQKKIDQTRTKKSQMQKEDFDLLMQQQQYQQQQREMMARYHLYSNQNSQMQMSNIQAQVYQKPKSNDIVRSQNSPSAQNAQIQRIPNQLNSQYYQHHPNSGQINYHSNKNNQSGYNFQFQNDMSSQDFELQNPQFLGRHQSANQQQPQQQIVRNIQHQHNFTQMPTHQMYQFSDSEQMMLPETRLPQNMVGAQPLRKITKQYDQRGMLVQKNYHSGSNSSIQPSFQNLNENLNEAGQIDIEDHYEQLEASDLENMQYMMKQESDYSAPQVLRQYMMGGGVSADFNLAKLQNIRQQSAFHQRYGSSFSQLNMYPNLEGQHSQPVYVPQIQSIEDHIKRTQLSEQKLGRGHMTQFYGNNPALQHHIQHKSVISNFQNSNSSPKTIHNQLAQQQALRNQQIRQDGMNGSFENFLDTVSNNDEQYLYGTLGIGQGMPSNVRASIINMQNLKNVRESYSKKFAEEVKTNEEQRLGMMMMMAIGNNEQESQTRKQNNRGSNRSQNIDQMIRQTNQSIQMQSIGSGRSNGSVQINNPAETEVIDAMYEECEKLISLIKFTQNQLEKLNNDPSSYTNQEIGFTSAQTQITEENQEIDIESAKFQKEQDLIQYISNLSDKLKLFGSQKQKAQLAEMIGYHNMINLLNLSDEVVYPTLLLINFFCESSMKVQDNLCICGFLQYMIRFSNPLNKREIILDIGYFIGQIFQSQSTAFVVYFLLIDQFLVIQSKDMIMLAIDAYYVLSNEKIEYFRLPIEDITIFLSKYQIIEKITAIIPKLYQDIETSEVLVQQEQMQNYLEKAFDILQKMMSGPHDVVQKITVDKILRNTICKILQETLNDPSHQTLDLEKNDVVKMLVEMLQFFLNDIDNIQLQHQEAQETTYGRIKFMILFSSNLMLIEKMSNQLISLDKQIAQADENAKRGKIHHHNKNSSSARSINNMGSLGSQSQFGDADIILQNKIYYNQRIQQNVLIMKELMEIFKVINPKIDPQVDFNQLIKIFQKLLNTAEKHNFVIIQEIAQNLIIQSKDIMEKRTQQQQTLQTQQQQQQQQNNLNINQQQNISEQNNVKQRYDMQMKPGAMQLAQNMRQINNGVNSTRAKSPLFQ
ncbi:protein serine threonine kinase [Stylonychia lemnae]|uniref:Protein serine threonine kinase n=1 Tax=Stylonychia lemnae TaxID=5949 RepID=A0A078B241_STYLE|nr:protein serine threonine kinase [Stylonychia lemnae]|eukprot:CDW87458.1 protein serine threonine kinase [Stylonychia lemnae]